MWLGRVVEARVALANKHPVDTIFNPEERVVAFTCVFCLAFLSHSSRRISLSMPLDKETSSSTPSSTLPDTSALRSPPPTANAPPPPPGDRVWVPPIDWVRHLVGHPELEQVTTKGRTRYREPNMAHPPPSTTPTDTMAWETRTWVDHVASVSNFTDHVPSDIPTPSNQQPAPSMYMTLMYSKHYTLSTTHYHAPTDTRLVHGTESFLPPTTPPPPAQPRPRHIHQRGRV